MAFEKLKESIGKYLGGMDKPRKEFDDDETRDNYLRSLRRQRRVQMEEVEKERLKKEIASFESARTKKHLYGFKERPEFQKKIGMRLFEKQKNTIQNPMKGEGRQIKSKIKKEKSPYFQ